MVPLGQRKEDLLSFNADTVDADADADAGNDDHHKDVDLPRPLRRVVQM